jgi:ubiquinone/menaquinone biosynthesis C-methylase UbiE
VNEGIEAQLAAAEATYRESEEHWEFHFTNDPLTRYLRDRRLEMALDILRGRGRLDPANQSALLVCGGVGGEGIFLANHGFRDVTVSDFSESALAICRRRDPRLKTALLNAEDMSPVPDRSYDVVLVQDGLHHLPRPVLGLTEMLRVARVAAVVIEPHRGLVGRFFGTEWEVHGSAVNYVFRWNRSILEQTARSYLLEKDTIIELHRVWDHNVVVRRIVERLPPPHRVLAAKSIYHLLSMANWAGNMMVGVVIKSEV